MSARLANKVALVKGGQGIGGATADAFSREGATVIVADNNRQTSSAAVEFLTHQEGRAIHRGRRAPSG